MRAALRLFGLRVYSPKAAKPPSVAQRGFSWRIRRSKLCINAEPAKNRRGSQNPSSLQLMFRYGWAFRSNFPGNQFPSIFQSNCEML